MNIDLMHERIAMQTEPADKDYQMAGGDGGDTEQNVLTLERIVVKALLAKNAVMKHGSAPKSEMERQAQKLPDGL